MSKIWDEFVFSGGEVGEFVRAEGETLKASDGVAESGEGAADLAITTFGHFDAEVTRAGEFGQDETGGTIRELDAKIGDGLLVERGEIFIEMDFVNFGFMEFRVSHLVIKIAVVRQENQAFGVTIEAADGFEVMKIFRQEGVNRRRSSLLMARTDVADGFIQGKIEKIIGMGNSFSVEFYFVGRGNSSAELGRITIHENFSAGDFFVSLTTRKARMSGEKFIQAERIGLGVRHSDLD